MCLYCETGCSCKCGCNCYPLYLLEEYTLPDGRIFKVFICDTCRHYVYTVKTRPYPVY